MCMQGQCRTATRHISAMSVGKGAHTPGLPPMFINKRHSIGRMSRRKAHIVGKIVTWGLNLHREPVYDQSRIYVSHFSCPNRELRTITPNTSRHISQSVQVRGFQCRAISLFRHGMFATCVIRLDIDVVKVMHTDENMVRFISYSAVWRRL